MTKRRGLSSETFRLGMHDKHKGAWAEFIAYAQLLSMGFQVFRNVCPHGEADLIVYRYHSGEMIIPPILVDVKSVRPDGSYPPITKLQKAMGVEAAYVFPDGRLFLCDNPPVEGEAPENNVCIGCGKRFDPSDRRQTHYGQIRCEDCISSIPLNNSKDHITPPLDLDLEEIVNDLR